MKFAILTAILAALLSSCCSKNNDGSLSCGFTLDQCSSVVSGYVLYANGTRPTQNADVVIEWSTDSFATVTHSGQTVNNAQGFVAVPFSFDATYSCTSVPSFQVRALESPDHTGVWKTGNVVGRCDGTSTGNATYTAIAPSNAASLVIFFDGAGTQ